MVFQIRLHKFKHCLVICFLCVCGCSLGDAALSIKLQSGIKVLPGGSSALNIHKTSELLTSLLFTVSSAITARFQGFTRAELIAA